MTRIAPIAWIAPLIALALLNSAGRAGAQPQPGLFQYNADWAVGCDNLLRCEAIALQPPDAQPDDEPMLMQIARAGGPGGEVSIRVSGLSRHPGDMALLINGAAVATLVGRSDEAVLAGPTALAAVQALAGAVTIELATPVAKPKRGQKPPVLARLSAAGLEDSLRFIDTRQGRTNTAGAFVTRGKGDESSVPPPPPIPVVRQMPSPDADSSPPLDAPELASARKLAVCDPMLMAKGAPELFPLDHDAALLLLPCEAGAYNVSAVPLIARGPAGARILSIARFDFAPGFTGEPGKPPLVVNALWDARRGVLSSLAKGRGIGDCGASEDYVWDGATFRLIESRAMHVCRGAWEWIRLWEAKVEREPGGAIVHATGMDR